MHACSATETIKNDRQQIRERLILCAKSRPHRSLFIARYWTERTTRLKLALTKLSIYPCFIRPTEKQASRLYEFSFSLSLYLFPSLSWHTILESGRDHNDLSPVPSSNYSIWKTHVSTASNLPLRARSQTPFLSRRQIVDCLCDCSTAIIYGRTANETAESPSCVGYHVGN